MDTQIGLNGLSLTSTYSLFYFFYLVVALEACMFSLWGGERGGSVVECRTPEREVRGSRPTSAVLCPWARPFTPRKYWFITQEAMAPSRHDWKIVDWDVKPQHNQPNRCEESNVWSIFIACILELFLSVPWSFFVQWRIQRGFGGYSNSPLRPGYFIFVGIF